MNEDNQTQTEQHRIKSDEDEIKLNDFVKVIWKWKYLILLGTFVFGLSAMIISFNKTKMYSIVMLLRPATLSIGKKGGFYIDSPEKIKALTESGMFKNDIEKIIYISSPPKIKALIESGAFNNNILSYLNDSKMDKIPKALNFEVKIIEPLNNIEVKYKTASVKQGVAIMDYLSKLLLTSYSPVEHYVKSRYDMKLSSLKFDIDYIKTAIQSSKRNVKNLKKRINELTSEIKPIKSNITNLFAERNKLLSKNPKDNNIITPLLYSLTIQQGLEYLNSCKNKINEYMLTKEKELQEIKKSENELINKLNEIKNIQSQKDDIKNIHILKPPTNNPHPIESNKKLIVMSASAAGLFSMVFLVFFLEYWRKHNKGKTR